MIRKVIFTLIYILLFINFINATKVPTYDISDENLHLNDFTVGLIIDPSQIMQIQEIAEIKDQARMVNSRFTIKSINNNYWFVFKVKNSSKETIKRILGFDEVYMETADIYYQTDSVWHHERNGLSQGMKHRQIKNRCPVFYVSLKPNETKTIYLKLHSKFALVCGITIENVPVFAKNEQIRIIGYWTYFGAAMAIILYNLFLLFQIRNRVYLYYVIYASCLVIFVFLYSGYSLYVNSSVKFHYMLHASISSVGAFIALFTRELLKPKSISKWIDNTLLFISGAYFILAILIIVDIYFYQWMVLFGMPSMLFLLFTGIYSLIKKVPLARFYVIAMSSYLIGLFMIAAVNLGIIPFNTVTRYGFIFGSFIELSVFSLALGYRVKLLQIEKEAYQNKLLITEKSMKKSLELQVSVRTEELTSVVEELNTTNEQLLKLSYFKENMTNMIAHDLKNPLNTIINISSLENMQDKEKFIQQTGRQMLNLVTNMIDVYKSEYAKLELNISETSLQKLINQALGEVDFLVNYKDLKVKLSLDKNVVVQVDKEIIKRVFVNLFTNAIKFSPQNGIITVESIVNSDDGLRICIENQGYGIPKENQETIFELYKQDKRMDSGAAPSSGLGLAFCKMAVEAHNGKIGVISESETGVEFWITLPKYQVSKTPIKNVKTEVYQELDLSESDKEYLLPFINQIMTFNIFEISSINSVLKSIDNKNSNIENWVEELTEVLYSGNEDRYNRLIRL